MYAICIHMYSAPGGALTYRAYSSVLAQRTPQELLEDSLAQVGLPIDQPHQNNMTAFGRLIETQRRRTNIPLQDRANGIWAFVDQDGTVIRHAPVFSVAQEQEAMQYAEQHPNHNLVLAIHSWCQPL